MRVIAQLRAVKAVVIVAETGACYRAEDGAIMYCSAQYTPPSTALERCKTDDGSDEEAHDDMPAPTAS